MAWIATSKDTARPCQKEKNRIPLTQRNLAMIDKKADISFRPSQQDIRSTHGEV